MPPTTPPDPAPHQGPAATPTPAQPPTAQAHTPDKIMKHFTFDHLREGPIRDTSAKFARMAQDIHATVAPGPEKATALRKLLEAKDAAVRAVVNPGY